MLTSDQHFCIVYDGNDHVAYESGKSAVFFYGRSKVKVNPSYASTFPFYKFLAQVPVALVMATTSLIAQRLVLNVRQACHGSSATTGRVGTLSFVDSASRDPVMLSNVSSFWSE